MTAGDKGTVIVIDAGGYNLTGSTCTLLAAPGKLDTLGNPLFLMPVVVSANGLLGLYTQTVKDFTTGGPWTIQLQVETPEGKIFKSPPRRIYVYPQL